MRRHVRRLHARAEALPRRLRLRPERGARRARTRQPPAQGASRPGPTRSTSRRRTASLAAGGKLADQEKFKRERASVRRLCAAEGAGREATSRPSRPTISAGAIYGLFYVAPAQNSLHVPAAHPERHPHALAVRRRRRPRRDATAAATPTSPRAPTCRSARSSRRTRVGRGRGDPGPRPRRSRGSGADNIRNVTGTPTAGIDPQELIDTRPLCARVALPHPQRPRALRPAAQVQRRVRRRRHASRCWRTPTTSASRRSRCSDGFGVEPGVWFRLALGGITGHRDFARDTGVDRAARRRDAGRRRDRARLHRARRPHQPQQGAAEIRARRLGLREVPRRGRGEARRASSTRVAAEAIAPRPAFDRTAHIGVHPQKQAGPATGSASCCRSASSRPTQMRGLATIARELGDGDIRLTVWQNLLISGVPDDKVARRRGARSRRSGSRPQATPIRAGLVACTGNAGCKFAASDTKGHAEEIADWCEARVDARQPVNIHLTGCHHSCAQHYIGDIGLIAARSQVGEDGDTVEGYHIHVGGGFGPDAALGREIYPRREGRGRAAHRRAHAQGLSRAPRRRRARPSSPSRAGTRSTRSRRCVAAEAVE